VTYPALCISAGIEGASTSNRLDGLWAEIRICEVPKMK